MENIFKKLESMKTDVDRINIAKKFPEHFYISLDNDCSSLNIVIDYDNWDDEKIAYYESFYEKYEYSFDQDFGNREGVLTLFRILGIDARSV